MKVRRVRLAILQFSVGLLWDKSPTFDGDGLDTKRVDRNDYILYPGGPSTSETAEYYVRSSVLGGRVVTELDQNGAKKLTNVYSGSSVLAEQRINSSGSSVSWRHEDAITGSSRGRDRIVSQKTSCQIEDFPL